MKHYPVAENTENCPFILSVAGLALTEEHYFKCMDSTQLSFFLVIDQNELEWDVLKLTFTKGNRLAEVTITQQVLVDVAAEEEKARAARESKRAVKLMKLGLSTEQAAVKRRQVYARRAPAKRRRQASDSMLTACRLA